MTTCAWLWLYLGTFLMLMELLTPGFVIFFFGLAAASVGLCRFVFGEAFGEAWQLAAFSGFAVFYLLVLRRYVRRVFCGDRSKTAGDLADDFAGRVGKVTEAVRSPQPGRALVGDAEWTVVSDRPIEAGAVVRVISRSNLTLKIEEIKSC